MDPLSRNPSGIALILFDNEAYVMHCELLNFSHPKSDADFDKLILFITNQAFVVLTEDYKIVWERPILSLDTYHCHEKDSFSGVMQYRAPLVKKAPNVSKSVLLSRNEVIHPDCISCEPADGVLIVHYTLQFEKEKDNQDVKYLLPVLTRDAWQQLLEKQLIPKPLRFHSHFFAAITSGKHANKTRLLVFTDNSLQNFRVKAVLNIVDCLKWSAKGETIESMDVSRDKFMVGIKISGKLHQIRFFSSYHLNEFYYEIMLLVERSGRNLEVKEI
ncbi:hypothetical protein GEMRC1_000318 [Eukaryota sp. GEM-RC1]